MKKKTSSGTSENTKSGEAQVEEFGVEAEHAVSEKTQRCIEAAMESVNEARRAVVEDARAVATKFNAARDELIGKPGIKFMGLVLSVTNKEDFLRSRWIELIFKEGKLKARISVPNQNVERSHLGTLLAKAPEEFHPAVREAEMAMRAIRRRAKKLNEAKRLLLEAGAIGSGFAAKPEPQVEDDPDGMPQF